MRPYPMMTTQFRMSFPTSTSVFGTGVTKIWRGRVTMIAAVTPVLDRYYAVFSVLGERFMQLRWHRPNSEGWSIRSISIKSARK